ncbi:MAG: ATP-binding cassette domain-containing protein, partial [Thermoproteota archaeon]
MGRAAYIASSVAVLKMGIKLENVSSKYSTVKIIHNVSLNLDGRNIVLGPNGSGKTTLFRTILGLSVISEGRIIINGVSVEMLKGSPGLVVTNLEEVYGLLRVPVKGLAKFYLELCKGSLQFFLEMAREFELSNALSKRIDQLSAGQRKLVCNLIALSTGARH